MKATLVKTGNLNADFKLLTHDRYSVLNGHFVRQIHPSSSNLQYDNMRLCEKIESKDNLVNYIVCSWI